MSAELDAHFEKRFRGAPAIRARLRFPTGTPLITALFGPSGAGKTTVLRCLAGLERPEAGSIRWESETWFDAAHGTFLPPQRRGAGYLFQEAALFPHLTVDRNIAYGLDRRQRQRSPADLTRLLGLEGLEQRRPRELSRGQQQRVALARALAHGPRLLLLDEPFASLDAPAREQLRADLRRLLLDQGAPAIVVTHDRVEALALADDVIVLDQGRVRQAGPVSEVFARPADVAVAHIVGIENILPGRLLGVRDGSATVQVASVELTLSPMAGLCAEGFACIHAEEINLSRSAPARGANRFAVLVAGIADEGPLWRLTLDAGFRLIALLPSGTCRKLDLHEGDRLTACVDFAAIHFVPGAARAPHPLRPIAQADEQTGAERNKAPAQSIVR